ncbi:MAG: hypothetical protein ACLQU5_06490, partial [Isosphaeraceae bacterium]
MSQLHSLCKTLLVTAVSFRRNFLVPLSLCFFWIGMRGMVQLRVTAIPEVAIPWSSGFSRLTDRPADANLANGTKSAMAFSGWHARVLASMECRRGHAG